MDMSPNLQAWVSTWFLFGSKREQRGGKSTPVIGSIYGTFASRLQEGAIQCKLPALPEEFLFKSTALHIEVKAVVVVEPSVMRV